MRRLETLAIIVVLVLVVVLIMVRPSFAGGNNPKIAPINSHPHGKSYGEWGAAWWQWALEVPASTHPLLDLGDCSEGQTGHVWFLGGTFASNPGVERDCTIPSGTALFFPLINAFHGAFLTDPPDQRTEAFLRAQVQCTDVEISATIDGVAVHDPLQYCTGVTDNPDCADSPLFDVQLPEDNVFGGVPEATCDPDDEGCDELVIPELLLSPSAEAGYYLFLHPLPTGEHTIEFEASQTCPFGSFTEGATYNIVVSRGRRHMP